MTRKQNRPAGDRAVEESKAAAESLASTVDDGRLTKVDARRLTQRIHSRLVAIADNQDRVLELIGQARDGSAHEALGYKSWTDYVSAEFGGVLPRLTAADRQPLVQQMAELGMSTRAIAPVVGASQKTISRDLSGESSDSPDSEVTGIDGKTYPPARARQVHRENKGFNAPDNPNPAPSTKKWLAGVAATVCTYPDAAEVALAALGYRGEDLVGVPRLDGIERLQHVKRVLDRLGRRERAVGNEDKSDDSLTEIYLSCDRLQGHIDRIRGVDGTHLPKSERSS